MNKTAIKNYAIWARVNLIEAAKQKAFEYEITENGEMKTGIDSVGGRLLSKAEKEQRNTLIAQIRQKGFNQVMEEVAYTWFNRFIALRFMEVNGYLPSKIRIFTDENGAFKPEILKEATRVELEGIDRETVIHLLDKQDNEGLYKYLLITQCNALNAALPGMFEKIANYTELLFPNNLLKQDSVIGRMISDIPEEDWTDAVQIIGWLYQYYISEKHDQIININKGTVKKEDIPAATQLFTTDWVVRYMVDNSLGRYWIERNPNSRLAEKLQYFVTPKNGKIKYIDEQIRPEDLTFFDPCMGSGHILVYAFDVLMEIYRECGYSDRDAAKSIVENNLYGLDIDDRCSQLAYFAVLMKARSFNRRILISGISPKVFAFTESDFISDELIDYVAQKNPGMHADLRLLRKEFKDAKELGSILQCSTLNYAELYARITEISESYSDNLMTLEYKMDALDRLLPLIKQAEALSGKYAVVCTNPPYLNKFEGKLKAYLLDNYKDYSGDLFSVFVYQNFAHCKQGGYSAFMTPFVWMFIKTYEKLRNFIIKTKHISTLIQFEYSAFEEATVPICSFVLQNAKANYPSLCFRLSDFRGGMEVQKQKVLEALADKNCGYFYEANQSNFSKISGSPVAYWVSTKWLDLFEISKKIAEVAKPRVGQNTGDNDRFLRLWFEVDQCKIGFGITHDSLPTTAFKWIPYSKGGPFRRWYGNYFYVINWENDGKEIKEYAVVRNNGKHWSRYIQNLDYMCCEGVTWSDISSSKFACRFLPSGFICDVKGSSAYPSTDSLMTYLAFLNSNITYEGLKILAPTISFQTGDIGRLPFSVKPNEYSAFNEVTKKQISLSKDDWDSFETSWDFKKHPLI